MEGKVRRTVAAAAVLLVAVQAGAQGREPGLDLYEKGLDLERRRPPELQQAARLYGAAAELGHVGAKVRLGHLLQSGRGVEADPHRAVLLYREAAEEGDRDGQVLLGLASLSGVGTGKDAREARRWFGVAAKGGDQQAQLLLGLMLKSGEGGARHEIAAGRWFSRAAEGPDPALAERAEALRDEVQRQANTREEVDPAVILGGLVAIFALGLLAGGASGEAPGPSETEKQQERFRQCMSQYVYLGYLEAQFRCMWLQ